MRAKLVAAKALMYAFLICYLIFLAFPLVWMLSTALKPATEIASRIPTLLPQVPTLIHFTDAFAEQRIVLSVVNSLKVASITAITTVLVAMPAAYALARYQSAANKAVQGWVMLSQVFPFILIIIPLFLILRTFALTNKHSGLIIVYLVWGLPFALWMLQGYVRSIPPELEEAASVDGAGRWQTLAYVVGPLLRPGIVATGLFTFISAWNEFFFGLVLLKNPALATLPIALAKFTGVDGTARWGELAAASLVATIPSLILFSILQRGLTSGLLSGAVKQ